MPRNGRTARYKVTTGSEKRELEMNRLIHMGGLSRQFPGLLWLCQFVWKISRYRRSGYR